MQLRMLQLSQGLSSAIDKYGTSYSIMEIGTCQNQNIIIPVTTIADWPLENCSFTSIILSDTITYAGEGALYNCSSLTSITILNSVRSMGRYAFDECNSLTDVYYDGTIEDWCKI